MNWLYLRSFLLFLFSLVYIVKKKKKKGFEQYFLRHVVGQLHVALASLYAYLPGSSV